jgi:hypothetical protein
VADILRSNTLHQCWSIVFTTLTSIVVNVH